MLLFDCTYSCKLCLPANVPTSVRLAADDLRGNLLTLSGKKSGFPLCEDPTSDGITIALDPTLAAECYRIRVSERSVTICGGDALGTVFGIYAFATHQLRIPPAYRFTDLFPPVQDALTLAPWEYDSTPHRVRYRGWFLNDEDLLTEWRISGGKRRIDYRFYQDVMDVAVLDLVLETALRMEINLMIPSSFLDLENPWEEALVRRVWERGLYLTQHHVEPLGVSYFAIENYIKSRGLDGEEVSFITNRPRLLEIWRYYVRKWLPYADRVIWQLGLRGKADVPVWQTDASCPTALEDCGRIISEAMAEQHRILEEELGRGDFDCTATLWHEGSLLYGKGYLTLPDRTMIIFSDFGIDQTFGEDFYTIKRKQGVRYGIYYHAAFFPSGAHLAELVLPEKMSYFYGEARRTGTLDYSILNVSNLRPLHFILEMNSALLRQGEAFDPVTASLQFDCRAFGAFGERVHALRQKYYRAFADFGEEEIRSFCKLWHFFYREYPDLPFVRNPAGDGQIVRLGKQALGGKLDITPYAPALRSGYENFSALAEEMASLASLLPDGNRRYFEGFLMHQTRYLMHLYRWAERCVVLLDRRYDLALRRTACEEAVTALDHILQERERFSCGPWEHWYRGEKKLNIRAMKRMTQEALAPMEEI